MATVTFVGTNTETGATHWHFRVTYNDGYSEPLHLQDGEGEGWDQAAATARAEDQAAELEADRALRALEGLEV
ncbi:MAG TPA: hypothetical protein PLT74_12290 [Kiritimatiellia bacterium]|nr:hypothetical protein [Kiritimatiellia bacterium]